MCGLIQSQPPLIRSPTSPTRHLRHAKSHLDSVPFPTNFSQTLVSLGRSEVAQSYSRVASHPILDLRINDLGKHPNAWLGWTRTRFPGLPNGRKCQAPPQRHMQASSETSLQLQRDARGMRQPSQPASGLLTAIPRCTKAKQQYLSNIILCA